MRKQKNEVLFEKLLPYFMILPVILLITCITIFPIVRTFMLSTTNMRMQNMSNIQSVGLANYAEVLSDSRFWGSLGNTCYFTFFSVLLELIFGFLLAQLMNLSIRGRGILRATVLIPWAIPTSISAIMWRFIYHDQFGVLNDILIRLGIIDSAVAWLGDPKFAMWSAIICDVWKTTPFMALLILAGLQSIGSEIYEAADVDGAGFWTKLYKITLPMIIPTILVSLIFRTLDAFRIFDLFYVLTGGGPANSTETLSMYAYKLLFGNLDFGKGSTVAVLIFVCTFIISQVYIYFLNNKNKAV